MPAQTLTQGDSVGQDKIVVGDVVQSYVAIGTGAQLIVNEARSLAQELDTQHQLAERRLAAAIEQKAERYAALATNAATSSAQSRTNPYRSLLNYRVEDAHLFYGRDEEIATLLERLQNFRLTILYAESGAGKTSLLEAGIAARLLTEGCLPLLVRSRKREPSLAIKQDLLATIESDLALAPLANATLPGFLTLVYQQINKRTLYVFLDQFEEFFIELSADQQEKFAKELGECVADSSLDVRWILALRKESFSDLQKLRPHIANPFANDVPLQPFSPAQARIIITAPALSRGIAYDPNLPDLMIRDLLDKENETQPYIIPPQLQIVCFSLFEALNKQELLITHEHYQKVGGAAGLLRNHLQDVLNNNLYDRLRPKAIRLLDLLVDSDGHRVARSRPSLRELLVGDDFTDEDLDSILTELYANHLVRFLDEGETGYIYELAHDYLASEIRQSPEAKARKAALELLARELANWKQASALMRPETLRVVATQRKELRISQDALSLLVKSAFEHAEDAKGWLAYAPRELAQEVLLDGLKDPRDIVRIRAIQHLAPYLDQTAAKSLTGVAESDPVAAVRATAIQLLMQVAPEIAYRVLRATPFTSQAELYAQLRKVGVRLPRLLRWQMAPARTLAYLQREWKERPLWLSLRMFTVILLYGLVAWWQGFPPFVRWNPVPSVPQEEISALAVAPDRLYIGSNNHGLGYLDLTNDLTWVGWLTQTLPTGEPAYSDDPTSNVKPITELVINPQQPEQLYIFIRKHGVLRSDDGGHHWNELSELATLLPVQSVTLTLSLDTWDRFVLVATLRYGLYGSTDHGQHWTRLDQGSDVPTGPYNMVQFDPNGQPYLSTKDDLYRAPSSYPWVWEKVSDVSVRYIDFSANGERAFLAIGWPNATIVACFDQSTGLGQLLNFYDNDSIITTIAADPTDDRLFYVAALGEETQRVACDGSRRHLGRQSLLSFVNDLVRLKDDSYLYQATNNGLYRRRP
jgi:hypothetical protein